MNGELITTEIHQPMKLKLIGNKMTVVEILPESDLDSPEFF